MKINVVHFASLKLFCSPHMLASKIITPVNEMAADDLNMANLGA